MSRRYQLLKPATATRQIPLPPLALAAPATPPAMPKSQHVPALAGIEQQIWEILHAGALHIDEIYRRLSEPFAGVSSALGMMEIQGIVRNLGAMRYERSDVPVRVSAPIKPDVQALLTLGPPCPARCYCCGGTRFWERPDGDGWVCEQCHPDPFAAPIRQRDEVQW